MDIYEKKYNEAFEKAKKEYNGAVGSHCDVAEAVVNILQGIFPQLRESEDERIRKEIIEFVDTTTLSTDERHHRWIAYLEKQKEPENVSASTMAPSCWAEEPSLQKEHKPNIELIQRSWYMAGYNDRKFGNEPKWIIKTGKGGPKHELNPKYGQPLADEQKPAECIEDSVKFEEGFKAGRESGLRDGQKYVLNNLDSYGLCKTAEWSEEDERRIDAICELLENTSAIHPNYSRRKLIIWLKSLRPSWKPSEEQMEALKCAILDVARFSKRGGRQVEFENEPYYMALHSLYEQLKKL